MRRLSAESFAGVFRTQQNLVDSDMHKRSPRKYGGSIILVCTFITEDMVNSKEAHVAFCIEKTI